MRIGFIGIGKIAGALIEAICTSENSDHQLFLSPRGKDKSLELEKKFPQASRLESNQMVVDSSDMVFIALKPDVYEKVLDGLSFNANQNIVSLVPFSTIAKLSKLVEPASRISRATPLPTVVNHLCPIQVYRATPELLTVFESIGQPLEIDDEDQLHTIWTLSCLISPYYDLMEELSLWAADNKVERSLAANYVAAMFNSLSYAAAKIAKPDFKLLSSHAATPGGLNEKTALNIMKAGSHKAYTDSANAILAMFSK